MRARISGLATRRPLVLDIDQGARPGADGVARHDFDDAVGPHDLPVGAARQNIALQHRPRNLAAQDVDDPPMPARGLPESWIGPTLALMAKAKRVFGGVAMKASMSWVMIMLPSACPADDPK